jgi:hypothetical protein
VPAFTSESALLYTLIAFRPLYLLPSALDCVPVTSLIEYVDFTKPYVRGNSQFMNDEVASTNGCSLTRTQMLPALPPLLAVFVQLNDVITADLLFLFAVESDNDGVHQKPGSF